MQPERLCVICEEEIPASRGERSTTCSKDCAAINAMDNPVIHGPVPERRLYNYPETEYARAIAILEWNQIQASKRLGVDPRTSRRYTSGDLTPPRPLQLLLRILVNLKRTEKWFLEVTKDAI